MFPVLTDPFGRRIEYLRLSVTDRCDLRCVYCLPEHFRDFSNSEEWLTMPEIVRVVRAFVALGVRRVRLTGGEPLVRRDLADLAGRLAGLPGLDDLSLSTNAVSLERQAEALYHAGIKRINVSLDSLQPERFKQITRGGKLSRVLAGLMAAKAAGFAPIKLNMVVMQGVNADEVVPMVHFCLAHGFALRFIETMPVGGPGQAAQGHYLSLRRVREQLEQHFNLLPSSLSGGGPARYVQVAGTDLKIGFITPMSQHFCETCNRVRLTPEGQLYLCLGQEHRYDFRALLRQGVDDDGLHQAVHQAIALKPQRHEFNEVPQQIVRFMAKTGG